MTARQVVSTASGVATLASLAVVIAKQNGWAAQPPWSAIWKWSMSCYSPPQLLDHQSG